MAPPRYGSPGTSERYAGPVPRNFLFDVDVKAISLVKQGANRKRFFLKKEDEPFELPPSRLVKADDWSAVYCVVAEPDWEEKPGLGVEDQSVLDVWKSEDEIRRAAHKFMQNGALVNKLHETMDPFGTIVENYIAPMDFVVDNEVIRKGSWVVAIKPTEEGKASIEAGEFEGVSIQGTGSREVAKQSETDKGATLEVKMDAAERTNFLKGFAKLLGASTDDIETQGDTGVADEKTEQRLGALEQSLTQTNEVLTKAAEAINKLGEKVDGVSQKLSKADESEDPAADIFTRLDEFAQGLDGIRSDVESLAKGYSTQPEGEPTNGKVNKSDNPLAGILFDE